MSEVKIKIVKELHKSARRNYLRRKVLSRGIHDLWQADLVDMLPYAKQNKGFKYLLTVIDVFSKFGFAEPVKSKSGKDVMQAMKKNLALHQPKHLQTDNGKEFYNSHFKELLKKYNISRV